MGLGLGRGWERLGVGREWGKSGCLERHRERLGLGRRWDGDWLVKGKIPGRGRH